MQQQRFKSDIRKKYVVFRRLSHYLIKGHYQWTGETPIGNSVVVPALEKWSFEIFSSPLFCSSVKFWGEGKQRGDTGDR